MSPLDDYPLGSYLVITFAFSWTAWSIGGTVESQSLALLTVIIGGFGPMVGALTMVRNEGEVALRTWLRRQLRFRGPGRWYVLALVIPLLYPVAMTAYFAATGASLTPSALLDRVPVYLGSLVFVFVLGGGQEEFGWRAYLQPRLLDRWDAVRTSLAIGVVWACWHLPLYAIPGHIYADRPFSSYILLVVAFAFVFTWLHEAADRRLPVVMLLHAGVNSTGALVPVRRALLPEVQTSHTLTLVMLATTLLILVALRVQSGGWRPNTGQPDRGAGGL